MGDDNELYEFSESDLDRFMCEAKTLVVAAAELIKDGIGKTKAISQVDLKEFNVTEGNASAVLTETEVPHDVAKAFSVEGFTVFCPPTYTTGPKGKEAGLIILVSNDITSFTVTRQDLNGKADTIPTAWIQLMNSKQNMDLIIGGVYRCSRTSVGDEKCEFVQLQQQILKLWSEVM